MKKSDRELIRMKFNNRCAYSGTILEPDWQVDHIKAIIRNWWSNKPRFKDEDKLSNMFPTQKLINHYKGSMDLELFRTWYLAGLHERLKTLPKNPRVKKSIKRKAYLLKVSSYFGITENKPFSGKFYFETLPSQMD